MSAMFDVRTLFLIGGLASLICAVALVASTRLHRPSRSAIAWSAAGQGFLAASMLGIALRGLIPDFASYVIANALGAGSFALLYESARRLVGASPRPALALVTVAASFAVQLALGTAVEAHDSRLIVTSVVQGSFAALMVPLFARRCAVEPRAALIGAAALAALFTAVHAARLVGVLLHGVQTSPDGSYVTGLSQSLVFALFALAPMLHGMLMLALASGRVASDLRALAASDELTGLLNRRSFFERARARLRAQAHAEGGVVGLLMIDLDHFKGINDRLGHAAGDRVLSHFGVLARQTLGPDCELGRYGGEEFCALLVRAQAHEIEAAAEALREAVAASRVVVDGTAVELTVSIGVTVAEDPASASLDELLRAADRRVYQAKALGRDRVVHADQPGPGAGPHVPAGVPAPDARSRLDQRAIGHVSAAATPREIEQAAEAID